MLAGNFQLLITYANGCSNSHTFGLSAPDRDDWQITGNSGSNPSSHFIGTLDNKDLVFKSFSNERLRIKSNGELVLNNFIGQAGMLSIDNNGILRTSNINPALACTAPPPGWLNFNNLIYSCPTYLVGIGTSIVPAGNILSVNGNSNFNGSVSINTTYVPANFKLAVNGKIIAEELFIKLNNAWPDYVFHDKYELRSLDNLKEYISKEHHLPNMPKFSEIDNKGISTGDMILRIVKNQEEQLLYIIQLSEQNKELKAEIEKLKKQEWI